MKVSLNWLKEFVDVTVEPREFKVGLTGIGLGVESFAKVSEDFVFEVEVTTNRPDCLNHYGMAREVATLYRRPLEPPAFSVKQSGQPATNEISIEIADPDLCARYCGRVIRDVQIKPSPAGLAQRLEAVGQRTINNIADVTNYVLMELGHPLHAFDLARLRQKKIIVRRAKPGERLRTLDGVDRILKPENLVIADAERAVALAGVMGGEDSGIGAATRAVLLESAWFEPVSIRRTSKAHGMHTEASHRFERGADIEMARVAIDRAAALITELAGGEVLEGVVDCYPRPPQIPELALRSSEVRRLLGAEVPAEEVERILRALGFKVEPQGPNIWWVKAPSWRLDVAREVDLVEEVARHFGYDRLPARVRPAPPRVAHDAHRDQEFAVYDTLVALGYREIITSSMVDPAENARFTERPPVVLANPLSQENSALRSTPVPSMLAALRWNLDRDQADLRLFEVGKAYAARSGSSPEERRVLTLGASGYRHPASAHESPRALDFFDVKGNLEALFAAFEVPGLQFEPVGGQYHEAGLAGRFVAGGGTLAVFGLLDRTLGREYKLRQAVGLAEVDLERLFDFSLRRLAFQAFSKFPAAERDFSLLVPADTPYSRLAEAIAALGLEEIRSFRPLERLPEGQIVAGYYSLLVRVTFQSERRTLTSDEIAAASRRWLAALEPLGARQRS